MATELEERVSTLAQRINELSTAPADKPTLVYLDIIGICWPIRCLLHLAEVDYELVQITIQEWLHHTPDGTQLLKSRMRNGHVPLYVDADVRLNQSNVILTYLGEKHDLIGDDSQEKLAAMEVMAHAYDALFHWSGLFQVNTRVNTPDDVVAARLNAFFGNGWWGVLSNGYHENLDAFERYLDANSQSGDFIVGSRLSVADLHTFNVLCNWYKAFDRERFAAEYPRLDAYVGRIASIPRVADYIRVHQEPTTWLPVPQLGLKLTTPEDSLGLTAAR
jgi:glutathione S-transferase